MSLRCGECQQKLKLHDSFTQVDNDDANSTESYSSKLKTAARLSELPALADSDGTPGDSTCILLCEGCALDATLAAETRLAEAKKTRDSYHAYLQTIQSEGHGGTPCREDTEDTDEHEAWNELLELEKEALKVQLEIEEAERELEVLDNLEKEYWHGVNDLQVQAEKIETDRESLHIRHVVLETQLDRLEKTNVYNDAFRIWNDGPFGTINGCRLGRLPNMPVEWNEINAAFGYSLLLVDVLATKLGFVFKGYKLIPMGSFSRIEKTDGADKVTYELYGSTDFASLLFLNRRFDHALVAFLNCIQQLADFVQMRDPRLKIPHSINKDKIGDLSIRVQFGQDEQWTRALKYMLIDIRWLLVHCVSK